MIIFILAVLLLASLFRNYRLEGFTGTGVTSNDISITDLDEVRRGQILDSKDALPKGIPRGDIPPGEEDLYIKKSEIVPPVCPKCPDASVCERTKPCPPCPAPQRCPEPSFECKKVPTYNSQNAQYLPRPVLTDFSQFGM